MAADEVTLGAVHGAWISDLLKAPIPGEQQATCSDCAMCKSLRPSSQPPSFAPDMKCCTYWPTLPNYLVGAILADESEAAAEGHRRIVEMIAKTWAVPLGLGVPPAYRVVYAAARGRGFARSRLLLCPYFNETEQNCTIWKSREAVCSTWFCKFDRGAVGVTFWDALQTLLCAVERSVSVWCARQLSVPPQGLQTGPSVAHIFHTEELRHQGLDGDCPIEATRETWGNWEANRAAFYRDCYRLASSLSWADVRRLGGVQIELLSDFLVNAFAELTSQTPVSGAVPAPVRIIEQTGNGVLIASYRETDPQWIGKALFDRLHLFVGRTLTEAVSLLEQDGVAVDTGMIHRLLDVKVLLPAKPSPR